MYTFVYDDELKYNCDVLDKINLKPYIQINDTPQEIMNYIQSAYEDNEFPEELNKIIETSILNGDLFNYITTEEFMNYLHERYKAHFHEITKYYFNGFDYEE